MQKQTVTFRASIPDAAHFVDDLARDGSNGHYMVTAEIGGTPSTSTGPNNEIVFENPAPSADFELWVGNKAKGIPGVTNIRYAYQEIASAD